MKLDPELIKYLTVDHFRVLTAIEQGMKNHEFVSVPLIESLANLKRSNTFKIVNHLLKHKCVFHTGKNYSGYALTYMGYDYLALRAFMKRGHIKKVTCQIGVGKESDIYICESGDKKDENGELVHKGGPVVIKFARLGRTSFRTIKNNRDYLKGRAASNWLYMSRIASLKEYAFMRALHERGFPTPTPIDANRHGIVMSLVRAYPMVNVKGMTNPEDVYHRLIEMIIRFAEFGLVHGDFNEFNLMINDDEEVTVIDFPQMVSTSHPNAQFYFGRDVQCIQRYFTKRFRLHFEGVPILENDVETKEDLDKEIKASGCFNQATAEQMAEFDRLNEAYLEGRAPDASQNDENDDDDDEAEIDEDNKEVEKEQDESQATTTAAVEAEADAEENDQDGKIATKVRFNLDQIEESKRLIREEVSSDDEEEQQPGDNAAEEEKKENGNEGEPEDGDEESEEEDDSDSGEVDIEAIEAARAAKKAKKLLPKKVKATVQAKEVVDEDGTLVVNMDYVQNRARRQYKNKQTAQRSKTNKNKDKGQMRGKEIIRDHDFVVQE